MTNHPNRSPADFYASRLRAERAAGYKIIEMIERDPDSFDPNAVWDVAIASPREGRPGDLVLLARARHARKVAALNALRRVGILPTAG